MCEREINWLPLTSLQLGTQPATQEYALTRNPTGNLSAGRPVLNPMSHTSQGSFIEFRERGRNIIWLPPVYDPTGTQDAT